MAVDPKEIAQKDFDSCIRMANTQANKFKDNPVKAKKYKDAAADLRNAKAKLDELLDKAKQMKISDGSGGTTTIYDKYVNAKGDAVTLAWLNCEIIAHESEIVSGPVDYDAEVNEIDVHYDFIDATKKVGHDLLNGKGLSKGLAGAAVGIGIGELLTKGVTSLLAKEGIIQSSMGLFGLGKLGITNLPTAFTALQTGMTALWGFSPLIVVAGGAFIALKGIPAIKQLIDKAVTKYKSKVDENNKFEKDVNDLIASRT